MIGIVAEGPSDVAVIRNILKGALGVDRDLTYAIRPELAADATDLANSGGFRAQRPEEFSNWESVLTECQTRTRIQDFLQNQIDDDSFVVVQMDTAEAHLPGYDITRPDPKSAGYVDALRALVVSKLSTLLGPEVALGVRFAICVEETDAWVLTIYEKQGSPDTSARPDPKQRLEYLLKKNPPRGKAKNAGATGKKYDQYDAWSRDFRVRKQLETCAARNKSLQLFFDSLSHKEKTRSQPPDVPPTGL